MTDMAFVRSEIAPARPAPARTSGFVVWARKNLFASVGDSILTLLAVAFLLWVIPAMLGFLVFRAVPRAAP